MTAEAEALPLQEFEMGSETRRAQGSASGLELLDRASHSYQFQTGDFDEKEFSVRY
jgi:hypothetical protein